MKTFTIFRGLFTIVFVAMGAFDAIAQDPNPLSTPAGDLYKHTEDPDLVTTGTQVPYLVLPDKDLNPGWVPGGDATNTTNLISTFNWDVPEGIGTIATNNRHYITINVTGSAGTTDEISVQEQSAAGCDGEPTTINVRVIAQPIISALAVSDGSGNDAVCGTGTNGSLDIPIPTFTVTKSTDAAIPGDAAVRVRASLVFTDFVTKASTNIFTDQILNVSAAGVVSNDEMTAAAAAGTYDDLDSWGTYTLTITHISDKISRKDINEADGYFAVADITATYTVQKAPQTGPIYHLPND